jgi:hypothetical protein
MPKRTTTHRRRQQHHQPFNFAGVLALLFGSGAVAAALILVWRGDPKGLGEWGLLIGNLTTGACGLLSQFRSQGRATDPVFDTHAGATVETTTTTTTPPEQEPEG